MEFALLGPLVVHHSGHVLSLAGAKERGVLAFLLLRANETVPADRLIDALWPTDPPASARNSLQVRVSYLRKVLGADRIETLRNGYRLSVSPDELDLLRFRGLVASAGRAREEGNLLVAAEQFADALALWRGDVLPEFASNTSFRAELAPLEEERLRAFEAWADAELELGRGDELVSELQAAADANPLRERLMSQLMLALYQAGRQVEALEAYGHARRRLVHELGLEPSPLLADLHQRILEHDPDLRPAPRRRAHDSSPSRRNVTVVLAAPVVSSDSDPEVAERSAGAGGSSRTRCCRSTERSSPVRPAASSECSDCPQPPKTIRTGRFVQQQELARANLRVGLDTGVALVFGREFSDARFISRVLRLADAAGPGDVILGAESRQALGSAVEVSGSRLLSFDPTAEPIARRFDAPLIGRATEFKRLRDAFDWAATTSTSHLVTILGPAGIGKSRLARELIGAVESDATVLTGRCLAYGSGAFWPLAEMVKQAAGDTTPAALLQLLADLEDRQSVVDQLAAALGTGSGMRAEDAFWAFRKLFGALAVNRPLVLVFEDLHWAEDRLLDFVEELVERTEGVALLVVCLARPICSSRGLVGEAESWMRRQFSLRRCPTRAARS